jgi:hypothetical protein
VVISLVLSAVVIRHFQHCESETPFKINASTSASGVKSGKWEYCLVRETEKSYFVISQGLRSRLVCSGYLVASLVGAFGEAILQGTGVDLKVGRSFTVALVVLAPEQE